MNMPEDTGQTQIDSPDVIPLQREAIPILVVTRGQEGYVGREVPILSSPFTIGRGKATLIIKSDKVSRVHAEIDILDDKFWIRDVTSKNGTYVNGVRIEDYQMIKDDDTISLGNDIRFHFRVL